MIACTTFIYSISSSCLPVMMRERCVWWLISSAIVVEVFCISVALVIFGFDERVRHSATI